MVKAMESEPNRTSGGRQSALESNILAIAELRRQNEGRKPRQEKIADFVAGFAGSMFFVTLHVAWFIAWIVANSGWAGIPKFDPFPYSLLTMIVSLEAIFLSTFVLISQNRMAAAADERAELDLQIDLLAEHEITRILKLTDAIANHLGLDEGRDAEADELEKDVSVEEVLQKIEARKKSLGLGEEPKS